jgi:hypothetical protein
MDAIKWAFRTCTVLGKSKRLKRWRDSSPRKLAAVLWYLGILYSDEGIEAWRVCMKYERQYGSTVCSAAMRLIALQGRNVPPTIGPQSKTRRPRLQGSQAPRYIRYFTSYSAGLGPGLPSTRDTKYFIRLSYRMRSAWTAKSSRLRLYRWST